MGDWFSINTATTGGDYWRVLIGLREFVSQLPKDCTRWLEFHPVGVGKNER
jgi:hypothetical protein